MPPLDALHAEMALRGAVVGLLLCHALTLACPGPRPAVRLALIGFVVSVLGYQFCQQAEVLLVLPRPLAYALLTFCVGGAAWLWVAARALFDDRFRWSAWVLVLLVGATLIGLSANVPYFPQGDGPYRSFPEDHAVVRLGRLHALCLLAFSASALWEVARGWRDDLVSARRATRRWVAMGIGLYASLALVIELALKGQDVGRVLPALHVLGIGVIALGLAVLVARHSLGAILGDPAAPIPTASPPSAPQGLATGAPASVPPVQADDRAARRLAALEQSMTVQHAYRRDGLGLAELARMNQMTEATLRELINQRLGFRNFNDFLHHHRLREATERLSREDVPILTIALECGYGSIGPFNRAFKQRLGMTPTEFRAGARLARAGASSRAVAPVEPGFDPGFARNRRGLARNRQDLPDRRRRRWQLRSLAGVAMSSLPLVPEAAPSGFRRLLALGLALLGTAAQAATGLVELPGTAVGQDPVAVFYPTETAGPPVRRWQFTLEVVASAPPARGNGRLVVISHGSPSNPWVNADLAIALTRAGFVVAMPWHLRDNSDDSGDAGPPSWKRRPQEVSAAIDTVMADPRFAPLLSADRVGAYGMSAGGHTVLTLAGGRWSPSALRAHCLAHLQDDFAACVGPAVAGPDGGWLDALKLGVARRVIGWKMDDPTWYGHTDARIAAIVAAVPMAADFDPATLAAPRVPLGLITARKDVWLVPRFHGEAVARGCAACERLADIAEGGHGAVLSPAPRREGRIAELVGDPPGFDRATVVPEVNATVVAFFERHLLP